MTDSVEAKTAPLLFNFSASFSGGGYKRLFHYARWFDARGGASFVVHPHCAHLRSEFPSNDYFVVETSAWSRLWDDCGYLREILAAIPKPALYYSYGIPVYARYGRVNWFHLSNALPLAHEVVTMGMFERYKLQLLGRRIRRNIGNADVVSAESEFSLNLLGRELGDRLFLSGNGGDDVLAGERRNAAGIREDIAVVVGTYRYKALDDALRVFDMLRVASPGLKLMVFGATDLVPQIMRRRTDVQLVGIQPPHLVIDALRKARYYISTTRIENSSNADFEGCYLAEEAYLSDIPSHREMLVGSMTEKVNVPGVAQTMLRILSSNLDREIFKCWNDVVGEMLMRYQLAENAQKLTMKQSTVSCRDQKI